MIKANELRIGNWIDVKYVNGSSNITRTQFHYDLLRYLHLADPIPLTPELLERCGFGYVQEIYAWADKSHYIHEHDTGGFAFYPFCDEHYCVVKSLHHLQNIIHSLTGSELEVKW